MRQSLKIHLVFLLSFAWWLPCVLQESRASADEVKQADSVASGTAVAADEANANRVVAGGVEFVFATAEQGRRLLEQQDTYTAQWSPFDRKVRIGSEDDPGTDEFLKFVGAQALDWPQPERQWATTAIESLVKPIEQLGIRIEEPIVLIHTTGREESGAAYTRENFIVVPRGQTGSEQRPPKKLMAHELFHVLSRDNPRLRDDLYATIGFHRASPIVMPGDLKSLKITNPDAPIIEHVIDIKTNDAETVTVAPVLFARTPFDPRRKVGLFGYLSFRLMEVEKVEGQWKAKLKDSRPIFHLPTAPDFQRQIGRNTSYIIHPEEVLADNFALMLLGTAVRDQWVQDEMRQAIKRHVVQP